jgi:hypothetical protein
MYLIVRYYDMIEVRSDQHEASQLECTALLKIRAHCTVGVHTLILGNR